MTKSARRATGKKPSFKGGNHVRVPHCHYQKNNWFQREMDNAPSRLLRHLWRERGITVGCLDELYKQLSEQKAGVVSKQVVSTGKRVAVVKGVLERLFDKGDIELEFDARGPTCRYRVSRNVAQSLSDERARRQQQSRRDRWTNWERDRARQAA